MAVIFAIRFGVKKELLGEVCARLAGIEIQDFNFVAVDSSQVGPKLIPYKKKAPNTGHRGGSRYRDPLTGRTELEEMVLQVITANPGLRASEVEKYTKEKSAGKFLCSNLFLQLKKLTKLGVIKKSAQRYYATAKQKETA